MFLKQDDASGRTPLEWRDADRRAVASAIALDGENAAAIQVRTPITDRYSPNNYDVDLMVFAPVATFLPGRRHSADPSVSPIDFVFYPQTLLEQPEKLAQLGLAAHRYMASEPVYDPKKLSVRCRTAMGECFYRADIQSNRIHVFFDTGFKTVREIGITWDFPELALFWLHMAYASCIAAAVDGLGSFCPNVFTRPLPYLEEIEQKTGWTLRPEYIETLGLDAPPEDAMEPLRRIQQVVSSLFAQPMWKETMRPVTRAEYAYTIASDELEFRLAVAGDMISQGYREAALYYLRFWAYSLARIPMIFARANEGVDAAFLQPECAVLPDLKAHCPEILPDLKRIFFGGRKIDVSHIQRGVQRLTGFRDLVSAELRRRGIEIEELREWRPHRPAPVTPEQSVEE